MCMWSQNSVIHAKNCHYGEYVNLRHNAVIDFIHKKTAMVYNDMEIEPNLRPVEDQTLNAGANVTEGARTDARVMDFGRPFQNTSM